MDNDAMQDELQELWDQEAAKLDASDETLADEMYAAAPDEPPLEEEPQAESQQEEDPFGTLPDAVRAKLAQIDQLAESNAQLLQHVKSAEGRVAAMQRELQVAKVAQQSVSPQEAPTQRQINAASNNPEKWEELRSDFPEWSDAIEEFVTAKLGSAQAIDPRAIEDYVGQQVAQTKAEMSRAIEEARIEGKYEDWRETVNTTEFAQWFTVQSADVQALAESAAARDAIRMLDLYHQTKSRSASDIKQEREARLAAAATTRPGQTRPPKTVDDMSTEELWNYEARRRERTAAERGY